MGSISSLQPCSRIKKKFPAFSPKFIKHLVFSDCETNKGKLFFCCVFLLKQLCSHFGLLAKAVMQSFWSIASACYVGISVNCI